MGKQNPSTRKAVYRLTLSDNESHKVIAQQVFTRNGLIYMAASAAIIVVLLFYVIFSFTPARYTIHGYPNENMKREAIATSIKVDSLESMLIRWELYAENLSRVLSGEQTISFDSLIRKADARYLSQKDAGELAMQDSLLRETVLAEEKFVVAGGEKAKDMPVEGLLFFTPVKGVIMNDYDKVMHTGVDIKVNNEAVVSSVLDGTVIYTSRDDMHGFTVMIQHRNNIISIYQMNRKLLKRAGDVVKAGDAIALAGHSEPYHLHFELWQNGETLNPTKYISFQ